VRPDARIAVTGATSVGGRVLRDLLAERRIGPERVRLLDAPSEEAILGEYGGEPVLIQALEPDSLADRDVVFLCGGVEQSRACLGGPRRPGSVFVDLSGAARDTEPGAPLINLAANPGDLERGRGTIRSPHPISFALSALLAPIEREIGIERAEAVVVRPAADLGEKGLEELHRQTASLLSFSDVPTEVFGRQLAFSLLSQREVEPRDASRNLQSRLAEEMASVLGWPSPRLTARLLFAPVFHGHRLLAHVAPRETIPWATVRSRFRGAGGAVLWTEQEEGSRREPAAESPTIRVTETGPDELGGDGFWIAATCTDLVKAAASNALEIAGRVLSG
jgi:aspartate-semialdehyde dehydrogenase